MYPLIVALSYFHELFHQFDNRQRHSKRREKTTKQEVNKFKSNLYPLSLNTELIPNLKSQLQQHQILARDCIQSLLTVNQSILRSPKSQIRGKLISLYRTLCIFRHALTFRYLLGENCMALVILSARDFHQVS